MFGIFNFNCIYLITSIIEGEKSFFFYKRYCNAYDNNFI